MTTLIAGLVLFFAPHVLPMLQPVRDAVRKTSGAGVYMAGFSLLSLLGLVLIVIGYREAHGLGRGNAQLYFPAPGMRHLALSLMLPAIVLLVAAYVPSRIRTWVVHPMLTAVMLWALAHLLVRGDLASVVLFGSFLAYAVIDRISVGRRGALGPLGKAPGTVRGDAIVIVAGLAAYALIVVWLHAALIGVSPIGG